MSRAKSLPPDVMHVMNIPGSLVFLHASLKTDCEDIIIESVDSISRDGPQVT